MSGEPLSLDSYKLYTIAWIAALDIERAAAEAMLDEEHEEPQDFEQNPCDDNDYTWGRMGIHNIVIASLPSGIYGIAAAAVTVRNLIFALPHIKFGVLVGIAGAIPQITTAEESGADIERVDNRFDIRLGDVVVGKPDGTSSSVVQYDLGKSKAGQVWERKGSLNAPPTALLNAIAKLSAANIQGKRKMLGFLAQMVEATPSMATANLPTEPSYLHQGVDNDVLFKAKCTHVAEQADCRLCDSSQQVLREPRKTTEPKIHYGVIASGNTLVKDSVARDMIAESTGENVLCYEMEAAGIMSQFPCLVVRGICDYADSHKSDRWQRYASATAAAYTKELLSHLAARKLETTVPISEVLALHESINQLQIISLEGNGKIDDLRQTTDSAANRALLSKLPVATEARYDSFAEGKSPLCFKGTRVQILSDILSWIDAADGSRVFWLNGMAGTGKSTISRTLAKTLDDRGQLGASFFFNRGEADRNSIRKLSSTIAADLAWRYATASTQILQLMSTDPSITTKSAQQQFKCLVLQPLSTIPHPTPVIIIIDALDECDETEIQLLFRLISDFIEDQTLPQVKFFLTSRPDPPVCSGFGSTKYDYTGIKLHDIERPIAEHDILVFLRYELHLIRENYNNQVGSLSTPLDQSWPDEQDVHKLLKMANKLFIFAATICKLLGDSTEGSPAVKLSDILSYKAETHHAFEPTYLPVLKRQVPSTLSKSQKKTASDQITLILSTLTVAEDLLSLHTLARLVDLDITVIEHRLNNLRSVIDILFLEDSENKEATQIRFLHLSFRDYLISSDIRDVSTLWVDEAEAHRSISSHCLRVLRGPLNGLKFNICGLETPGIPRSAVAREHIDNCLPSELRYACIHMCYHLKLAQLCISDNDAIHQFLSQHFLHWLEALSFLGHAFESGKIVEELECLLNLRIKTTDSSTITSFLQDAIHFVEANMNLVDNAPLQVYSSALIFSPRNSIIRTTFEYRYTSWIKAAPTVDEDWSIEFRKVQAYTYVHDCIDKIISSADESLLALISSNKIQIINVKGKSIFSFQGTGNFVIMAFSCDSRHVALGDEASKVQIWNIALSECIQLIETSHEGRRTYAYPISFVDNDSCVLTTSAQGAEIWCIKTGTLVRCLTYSSTAYHTALSPCNTIIAACFGDYIIVWNILSCEQIRKIECASEWVALINQNQLLVNSFSGFNMTISQSLDIWTVLHSENEVYFMSPVSGEILLRAHKSDIWAYTFAENSLIAVVNESIQIWSLEKRRLRRENPAPRFVDTIAYLPNASLLVVTSSYKYPTPNGVAFFWRLETGQTARSIRRRPVFRYREYVTLANGAMLGFADMDRVHIRYAQQSLNNSRSIVVEDAVRGDFWSAGQFLAIRHGSESTTLAVWEMQELPVMVRQYAPQLSKRELISVVFFSPDLKAIGILVDKFPPLPAFSGRKVSHLRMFCIATEENLLDIDMTGKFNDWTKGACISSDNRLLAVAGDNEACVWSIGQDGTEIHELFATNETNRAAFKENVADQSTSSATDMAVSFSPDSSFLLFARKGILEVWHMGQHTCLQRISRWHISTALMNPEECSILTNIGKISYRLNGLDGGSSGESALQVASEVTSSGSLDRESQIEMSYSWVGWGLSDDRCWISWNGENWLWLPLDSRPRGFAIDESSILLSSSQVGERWYEFVDHPRLEDRL